MTTMPPLPPEVLPAGVRARIILDINGLSMQVLEAGFETDNRPMVLLLHGFPELAYSWRKIIPVLADAGYHVVAPDLRGYGRTTGQDTSYDGDLTPFRLFNHIRDMLCLLKALGRGHVTAVVGHDFGAQVAAWCTVVRPDVFRAMTIMSGPFAGPPALSPPPGVDPIHAALLALPRPRKHYHWYYSTRPANDEMWHWSGGVGAFIRAYYHFKSADWKGNKPFPLTGWTASELAKIPEYYIMDADMGMAAQVAREMPSAAEIAACSWLTEAELAVYAGEYARTGFQGGLQNYRVRTEYVGQQELQLFAGQPVTVPSLFISGRSDWGVYQTPGAIQRMNGTSCTNLHEVHLIEGAGHWVQQEQPDAVNARLLAFLAEVV